MVLLDLAVCLEPLVGQLPNKPCPQAHQNGHGDQHNRLINQQPDANDPNDENLGNQTKRAHHECVCKGGGPDVDFRENPTGTASS